MLCSIKDSTLNVLKNDTATALSQELPFRLRLCVVSNRQNILQKDLDAYWLPLPEWNILAGYCFESRRLLMAFIVAIHTCLFSMWSLTCHPMIRLEHRSITVAKYAKPFWALPNLSEITHFKASETSLHKLTDRNLRKGCLSRSAAT